MKRKANWDIFCTKINSNFCMSEVMRKMNQYSSEKSVHEKALDHLKLAEKIKV